MTHPPGNPSSPNPDRPDGTTGPGRPGFASHPGGPDPMPVPDDGMDPQATPPAVARSLWG